MVCSQQFVDGRPTLENPNQTLNFGYEKPAKQDQRVLNCQDHPMHAIRIEEVEHHAAKEHEGSNENKSGDSETEVAAERSKDLIINLLLARVNQLLTKRADLESKVRSLSAEFADISIQRKLKIPLSTKMIKIPTLAIFNALLGHLKQFTLKLIFWRGSNTVVLTKKKEINI